MQQQAADGDWTARLVLELARRPARLVAGARAAVAVFTTLAAVIAGAVLAPPLAELLGRAPLAVVAAHALAFAVVLLAATVGGVCLVLGEILPRRLSAAAPDHAARGLAYLMHWFLFLGRPVAWTCQALAGCLEWLLGRRGTPEPSPSLEDIEQLLRAGSALPSAEPAEQLVARRALRLAERTVSEIMRPRIEIDALDVDTPPDEVIGAVAMAGFSRLPVHEGDLDHIIGFVYTKDLLRQQHMGWPIEIRKLVRPALLVPETLRLDKLLEEFRRRRTQMALVLDEFGGTEGLVTLEDVLEEIVGEIHDEFRPPEAEEVTRHGEHHWHVDGGTNLDDFLERIGRHDLCEYVPREFNTVAGLIMSLLGRVPEPGDGALWHGLRLEVLRMEGPRVERVSIITEPDQGGPAGADGDSSGG